MTGVQTCALPILQENYEVYGIDNRAIDNDLLDDNHFMAMDIRYGLEDFLFNFRDWPEMWDCVIHLAALVRVNESVLQPSTYYDTNINGTQNVLYGTKYKNFSFTE